MSQRRYEIELSIIEAELLRRKIKYVTHAPEKPILITEFDPELYLILKSLFSEVDRLLAEMKKDPTLNDLYGIFNTNGLYHRIYALRTNIAVGICRCEALQKSSDQCE
ncbi:hypothetical protein V9T40_012821 [Parthenolecanium corni]|uniref:Uncharacterized protein n=1 Tax=Parthenolecanium corni TaxID=536013 RepID=A0AAN9TA97_9HEMI